MNAIWREWSLDFEADCEPVPVKAQEFFRCHDAAHVVFDCGTTLDNEVVVKIAIILGKTIGLAVLKGYRLYESMLIYGRLRVSEVLLSVVHSVVIVPRTAFRCLAQRARWPWADHQQHLQTPLRELLLSFGITVAPPECVER